MSLTQSIAPKIDVFLTPFTDDWYQEKYSMNRNMIGRILTHHCTVNDKPDLAQIFGYCRALVECSRLTGNQTQKQKNFQLLVMDLATIALAEA